MKTPKDKAKELVDKFENLVECDNIYETPIHSLQIECAKIAVDEILLDLSSFRLKPYLTLRDVMEVRFFWQEVKNELNKML